MTAKQPAKLSATQVAVQIGTDAKTLRRFLRENDSYSNPGSGGRYEFVQKDVAPMKRAFVAWRATKPAKSAPKKTSKKSAQTSVKTTARKSATQTRAEKKSAADKRVDALEASLKSRGVHISQHRDER